MKKLQSFQLSLFFLIIFTSVIKPGTAPEDTISQDIVTIKSRFYAYYLTDTRSSAAKYLTNQDTSGMWPDINYADTNRTGWTPLTHLQRLNAMSVAYKTSADASYLSSSMLKGIIKGLQYWYVRKPVSLNWYQNQIAQQRELMAISILLENELKGPVLDTAISYFLDPTQVAASVTTGDNLFSFASEQLVRGALKSNDSDIVKASQYFQNEIRMSNSDGSIQADYSFHQHGAQLYNGGYGSEFLQTGVLYASILLSTKYAFADAKVTLLSDFLLNGTRLMVRGKLIDYGAIERGLTRKGGSTTATALEDACTKFTTFIPANAALYNDFSSHIKGTGKSYGYIGNKHFWSSDFQTHQRSGYYTSVKMVSSRTKGTELVNYENLKGYWLPFGSTFIHQTGSEYLDIFPMWDWARIPGVTCPHSAVIPSLPSTQNQTTTFVGGASDGMYGAAAMALNKLSTTGYKGYFYFDEEFVALGAGITSTNTDTINTTVNQCLMSGNVIADGSVKPGAVYTMPGTSWVFHNGVGYIFPDKPEVHLSAVTQYGTWKSINAQYTADTVSASVFLLWLNHGYKPVNASYSYIVLPATSQARVTSYALKPSVRIISNTVRVQAVIHDSLKVTEIIFYTADSVIIRSGYMVKVDKPCVVVLKEYPDSTTVALSDPTAVGMTVNYILSINGVQKALQFILPSGTDGGKSILKTIITSPNDIKSNLKNDLEFRLEQNYPNPFNPSTIIRYQIPKEGRVNVFVYSILGKEVMRLVDEVKSPGSYSTVFNGSGLASGMYFYRIIANDFTATKKLMLIK
jgi:chondroitin AC lyase